MFDAAITADGGDVESSFCFGGADSKALQKQVAKELDRVVFIPALAHGKAVDVFSGEASSSRSATVARSSRFSRTTDKAELARESDYIQPKLILGTDDWGGSKGLSRSSDSSLEKGPRRRLHHRRCGRQAQGDHLVREDPGVSAPPCSRLFRRPSSSRHFATGMWTRPRSRCSITYPAIAFIASHRLVVRRCQWAPKLLICRRVARKFFSNRSTALRREPDRDRARLG